MPIWRRKLSALLTGSVRRQGAGVSANWRGRLNHEAGLQRSVLDLEGTVPLVQPFLTTGESGCPFEPVSQPRRLNSHSVNHRLK